MAWNIGANDVANAMGTSVGSKALTLKKAIYLAAILEFSGAFLMGSHVSETIQTGIINPSMFAEDPMVFVLGMMSSLLATGILLQIASYFALPVSTTHALIGAIAGFGLIIGGVDAIFWSQIAAIAASWVISPILSGILSYFLFGFIQKKILSSLSPSEAMQKFLPLWAFAVSFSLFATLLRGGIPQLHIECSLFTSLSIAGAFGLIAFLGSFKLVGFMTKSESISSSQLSQAIALEKTEKIFVLLQIFSACLIAFAHGANDVANAIGPVAAVLSVIKTHSLQLHSSTPLWLLALGGGGIVIGLATWGWRVIETIGKKITELTPSRGFSAEFSAAITILIASKIGLPISSTHALVGAVLGVGLTRGLQALNLRMLREIALSWIVTIPLCALISILCFYVLRLFIY